MNIINVKSQTKLVNFAVVFHGSTLNEKPGWYGLSHLMEHLACKGIEHLYDEFDKNGLEWNAYTSETNIVFYMRGLEENVAKFKQEFLDSILYNFNISQEELDNEKKIVLEEYLDYFNHQSYAHIMNLFRKKFNRYTALGLKDDIANITLEDINEYHSKFLTKPSKLVNIYYDEVNKIDEMGVKEFSDTYQFEKLIMGTYDNDYELNNDFKDKDSIVGIAPILTDYYVESNIISLMLSHGLQSPLMDELREKRGLAYSVSLSVDNLNDTQHYIYQMVQTKRGNGQEVIDLSKEVFSNYDKYITQDRFDLIKQLLSITYKKYEIERYKHINKYIKQPQFIIEDKINDLTLQNIQDSYFEIFNPDKWYYSIDHDEFK